MAFKLEIVNRGLLLLGEPLLTCLIEDNNRSATAQVLYDPIKLATLRAHPWNFALNRSGQLGASSTNPSFFYAYSYPLPGDCLRVICTSEDEEYGADGAARPWKVEGKYIVTDIEELEIKYIRKNVTEGEFDDLFCSAFSANLALEMASPLAQSKQVLESVAALYEMRLREARTTDAQEGTSDPVQEGDWLTSRA